MDFEEATPLAPAGWSEIVSTNGSTLAVSSEQAKSPSRSLRVTVPQATSQSCVFDGCRRELPGSYQRLRTRIHVRPEGQIQPLVLVAGTATATRQYQLVVGVGQGAGNGFWYELQRADDGVITSLDYGSALATKLGIWSQIDVDWDAGAKRATITADGTPLVVALPADAAVVKPYVFFGAWCANRTTGAFLDDLAIWTE